MEKKLGIISAIPEEIQYLKDGDATAIQVGDVTFFEGEIEERPAIFVETGVGKVNAALVATLLYSHFNCHALLFSGIAGGLDPELNIGDVVIATRTVQYDYGRMHQERLETFQPGAMPMPGYSNAHGYNMEKDFEEWADRLLSGITYETLTENANPSHHFGTIVTGDAFINCEATRQRLHQDYDAMAVEMEGAAISQIATQLGLPWLVVRCLSDLAGNESHIDISNFLHVASQNAAAVTRRLVPLFD